MTESIDTTGERTDRIETPERWRRIFRILVFLKAIWFIKILFINRLKLTRLAIFHYTAKNVSSFHLILFFILTMILTVLKNPKNVFSEHMICQQICAWTTVRSDRLSVYRSCFAEIFVQLRVIHTSQRKSKTQCFWKQKFTGGLFEYSSKLTGKKLNF